MKKETDKDIDKFMASLILAAVVLMIFLGAIISIQRAEQQDNLLRNLVETKQELCVSCEQIELKEEEHDDLYGGTDRTMCCGQVGIILRKMVLKKLDEKLDPQGTYNEGTAKCSQVPAAQMNGIAVAESVGKKIIHWRKSAPSFLKGGVGYKDGRIIVPTTGNYFVYFQLEHRHNSQHTIVGISREIPNAAEINHNTSQTHYMYLYRHSSKDGQTTSILKTSRLNCKLASTGYRSTSNAGTVFHLNAYDELFVNTSNPDDLARGTERNYFGIFMS